MIRRWLLKELFSILYTINAKVTHMSAQLDSLTAQVSANTDVIESAVTLIAGLRQQIIDAGTDPAKLQALTDSLAAEDAKLAAAVAQNIATP